MYPRFVDISSNIQTNRNTRTGVSNCRVDVLHCAGKHCQCLSRTANGKSLVGIVRLSWDNEWSLSVGWPSGGDWLLDCITNSGYCHQELASLRQRMGVGRGGGGGGGGSSSSSSTHPPIHPPTLASNHAPLGVLFVGWPAQSWMLMSTFWFWSLHPHQPGELLSAHPQPTHQH